MPEPHSVRPSFRPTYFASIVVCEHLAEKDGKLLFVGVRDKLIPIEPGATHAHLPATVWVQIVAREPMTEIRPVRLVIKQEADREGWSESLGLLPIVGPGFSASVFDRYTIGVPRGDSFLCVELGGAEIAATLLRTIDVTSPSESSSPSRQGA